MLWSSPRHSEGMTGIPQTGNIKRMTSDDDDDPRSRDKHPGLRQRLSDDLHAPAPSAAPSLRFVLIACGIAIALAAVMLFVID